MLGNLIFVALGFLGFTTGESPTLDDVPWKEQLIQEAPKAWEKYFERSKNLQGTWSVSGTDLATKATEKNFYELKQRTGCTMILEQTDPAVYLGVVNPKYGFSLKKPTPQSKWAVTGVGTDLFKASPAEDPNTTARLINRLPFTFAGLVNTLQVTVLDPGFSIKKVAPFHLEGRQLVKVDFDYSPPKNPARMPLRGGSVLFDPERYWVIRKLDVHSLWGSDPTVETVNYDYSDGNDGFPILREIVGRRKFLNRSRHVEFKYQLELQEREIPEQDFRLSAFGFPEPHGITWDDGPRWYLWFIAAAVVCLAVGAYFRYRVHRRQKMLEQATRPS